MANLLWIIGLFLLLLWALGLITSYTLGGGIHTLLVLAIVFAILYLIFRRR